MPYDRVTLDVFLVTVLIPKNLPDDAVAKVRRIGPNSLRSAVPSPLAPGPRQSSVHQDPDADK